MLGESKDGTGPHKQSKRMFEWFEKWELYGGQGFDSDCEDL